MTPSFNHRPALADKGNSPGCTAADETTDAEQQHAFELWRRAKLKSDTTLDFADCKQTALRWVEFQNLFLGHTAKLIPLSGSPSLIPSADREV